MLQKKAIFTVEKPIDANKIQAALDTIKGITNPVSEIIAPQYQNHFERIFEGLFGIAPLDDAINTEINKIIDQNTGRVIALLIRNPEPFNHPKIPVEQISRNSSDAGMVEVLKIRSGSKPVIDTNYHFIYSKDYSRAIVMNDQKWISDSFLNFQFIYKAWDGIKYEQKSVEIIEGVQIN